MTKPKIQKDIEKWLAQHVPVVYQDGLSSLLHSSLVALGALPGLLAAGPSGSLVLKVLGSVLGALVFGLYYLKERGPQGDTPRFASDPSLTDWERGEKLRDSNRDWLWPMGTLVFCLLVVWL